MRKLLRNIRERLEGDRIVKFEIYLQSKKYIRQDKYIRDSRAK